MITDETITGSLTGSNSLNGSVNNSGTSIQKYTLPVASADILGGIKVGANLTIEEDGTLNAVAGSNSEEITEETDPVFSASASASITNEDISNWNNKSEFSGSYNDLTNKPTIPSVPTNVSSFTNDAGYLTSIPNEYVTETELNDAISGLGSGTGNVSSDVINSIVVVDELPTVEETGVLYLIKDTGTSTEPETPSTEATNLYYQSTPKDYTSSSSGYNFSWTTDCNVLFNSTAEMTKEREQSSGDFTLDLFEGKTYKLKATYVSGEMSSSSGTPYYHIYLKDSTTSTKYCELSLSNGQDTEETFTATTTETLTSAKMYVYVYTGTQYTNLVYNITLTEVA